MYWDKLEYTNYSVHGISNYIGHRKQTSGPKTTNNTSESNYSQNHYSNARSAQNSRVNVTTGNPLRELSLQIQRLTEEVEFLKQYMNKEIGAPKVIVSQEITNSLNKDVVSNSPDTIKELSENTNCKATYSKEVINHTDQLPQVNEESLSSQDQVKIEIKNTEIQNSNHI